MNRKKQSVDKPTNSHQAMARRSFLNLALAAGATSFLPGCGDSPQAQKAPPSTTPVSVPSPGASTTTPAREMARFPEKTDLILLTDRPPQLETPLKFYQQDLTPNDAFFVRWHLAQVPTTIDLKTFRLKIGGHVAEQLSLSFHNLRTDFEPVTVVAVNQCSGNSRSMYEPRVPGGQWGHGALGNARWTGVRLKDLLERASVEPGAVDVGFQGLDRPTVASVPLFAKSLQIDHALDGEVIVAYAMNDAPLPMLNGFPMRLVVPGWYATYWVKALNEITVLSEKFQGFWMDKAYRIPKTPDAQETPDQLATDTIPINRMSVRSLFVRPEPTDKIARGQPCEIEGLALDGGKGIKQVEVSTDGGKNWTAAALDRDLGKYSWRRWRFSWKPESAGAYKIMSRATNNAGEGQTNAQWNRSGYSRNVIESLELNVI
jgi:sulfite dehydrogenase